MSLNKKAFQEAAEKFQAVMDESDRQMVRGWLRASRDSVAYMTMGPDGVMVDVTCGMVQDHNEHMKDVEACRRGAMQGIRTEIIIWDEDNNDK